MECYKVKKFENGFAIFYACRMVISKFDSRKEAKDFAVELNLCPELRRKENESPIRLDGRN